MSKNRIIYLAVLVGLFIGPWMNYALTKNTMQVWPDLDINGVRIFYAAVQFFCVMMIAMVES